MASPCLLPSLRRPDTFRNHKFTLREGDLRPSHVAFAPPKALGPLSYLLPSHVMLLSETQ